MLVSSVIYWLVPGITFKASIVNAIPLSIISSAIAIPNFVVFTDHIVPSSFGYLFLDLGIVGLLGIVFTFILLYFISKNQLKVRFFILIAVLILLYASGKIMHFSSLVIIFTFGLILNNVKYIPIRWISKFIKFELLKENIEQFKIEQKQIIKNLYIH